MLAHETFAAQVTSGEMVEKSLESLAILDQLSSAAWMNGERFRVPKLSEFVSLQLTRRLTNLAPLTERVFEPKGRVLLAPSLIEPDLSSIRAECIARDVPLMVAFVDLDNFKKVNTELTEPVVDREVLSVRDACS